MDYRLKIFLDEDAPNPREEKRTLGYLVLFDDCLVEEPTIFETVEVTHYHNSHLRIYEIAEKIAEKLTEQGYDVMDVFPVVRIPDIFTRYLVPIDRYTEADAIGYYVVTEQSAKAYGYDGRFLMEDIVNAELNEYAAYVNRELFGYELYKGDKLIKRESGFVSTEQIRKQLPEEYQEEELRNYICF